ncbi:hypothetical protein NMY22_g20056 [Coprinellus aureogranulatus]|nr:hypothetical protein NMY22_g20056 [Coprinellus aureogranulatus]
MPPPSVIQRHPRYAILVAAAILTTIYLLIPYQPISVPSKIITAGADLEGRIEQSKQIYDRLLQNRKGLIKKFGPNPNDIALFPPDVAPWPPYTVWDFFPAAFNCPHEIERLGALGDGGKWVCGLSRVAEKRDCIVYSFGMSSLSFLRLSFLLPFFAPFVLLPVLRWSRIFLPLPFTRPSRAFPLSPSSS